MSRLAVALLVSLLAAAAAGCTASSSSSGEFKGTEGEVAAAIDDANEFDLEVRKVTVNGTTATADVQRGKDGPSETMAFARENGQWRATSLSERR